MISQTQNQEQAARVAAKQSELNRKPSTPAIVAQLAELARLVAVSKTSPTDDAAYAAVDTWLASN